MNIIGPKVRSIRESKHITQGLLAERCQELGWHISRGTLAKIEAQVRRVTDEEVVRLSKALDADIGILHCPSKVVYTFLRRTIEIGIAIVIEMK